MGAVERVVEERVEQDWKHWYERQQGRAGGGAGIEVVSAEEHGELCTCGALVEPLRTATSRVYYCQACGRDWTREAPRLPAPPPRKPKKRCKCATSCRYCGGRR